MQTYLSCKKYRLFKDEWALCRMTISLYSSRRANERRSEFLCDFQEECFGLLQSEYLVCTICASVPHHWSAWDETLEICLVGFITQNPPLKCAPQISCSYFFDPQLPKKSGGQFRSTLLDVIGLMRNLGEIYRCRKYRQIWAAVGGLVVPVPGTLPIQGQQFTRGVGGGSIEGSGGSIQRW